MPPFVFIYKATKRIIRCITDTLDTIQTHIMLQGNGVNYRQVSSKGIPEIMVARGGKCTIGANFAMNNRGKGNPIGSYRPCTLVVYSGAALTIGDNVGMSQTALIAIDHITIENNVKIGGGTSVFTSDFHSLDPNIRKTAQDSANRKSAPVLIRENAFIGAHSIILKGVTIGRNSIVGAGSVVTHSIPDNEIWAGNPAQFIRKIVPSPPCNTKEA